MLHQLVSRMASNTLFFGYWVQLFLKNEKTAEILQKYSPEINLI